MLTLAIETSTEIGGVCLYESSKGILGEMRLGRQKRHSATLMPAISYILKTTNTMLSDIDFFTVSIGPGSFTGLRVGLSTVKGLCYSTGKPLVAMSSLEAFSHQFMLFEGLICPLFDAKKNEVYGAVFFSDGSEIKRLSDDMVCHIDRILHQLDKKTLFAGTGAERYRRHIVEVLKKHAVFAPPSIMHPLASTLAIAAIRMAEKGKFTDPVTLIPRYIRPSEAELKFGERSQ